MDCWPPRGKAHLILADFLLSWLYPLTHLRSRLIFSRLNAHIRSGLGQHARRWVLPRLSRTPLPSTRTRGAAPIEGWTAAEITSDRFAAFI